MKNNGLAAILAAGLLAAAPAPAAMPDPGALQQSAAGQEQLRGETRKLADQLNEVAAEYARNGLTAGEDFALVQALSGTLGSLSDQEMEQVVALLKSAAATPEGAPGQAARAYAGQKDISLRLKQILAAHERQQNLDALARSLTELAGRQGTNLGAAIDVKALAGQDSSQNGRAAVAASEQGQQSEQGAIAAEVKLLAGKLARIASDMGDPKLSEAATQLAGVESPASAATAALAASKLNDAISAETAARQQLARIARAVTPAESSQAVDSDAGKLSDVANAERALMGQTAAANNALKRLAAEESPEAMDKEMYAAISKSYGRLASELAAEGITPSSPADQIRNAPEMQQYLAQRSESLKRAQDLLTQQLSALGDDQAALAAKAQMIREDLQQSVQAAAAPMANALTQMNTAQNDLAQSDPDEAIESETDAANQLDEAARLAGQSEAGPAQPRGSRQQQLADMQRAVEALAKREADSIQQGDAQKTGPMASAAAALQQDLAAKTAELQQQAVDQGSPGAQPLQQAGAAMQNAARAMQAGTADAAQGAQQAAAQSLQTAGQQLALQAAAAARQQQQLARMERQMTALARLIQEQQQTNFDSAKAQATGRGNVDHARGLGHQQGRVRKEAEAFRADLGTANPGVAQPIDNAEAEMGDAVEKLDSEGVPPAQPSQNAALAALYQAQDALASAMQQAAQDLGEPSVPQPVLNAQAELTRAQAAVAAAQQAAQQNDGMREAGGKMTQAGQIMAQAGRQAQALSQGARDAIRQGEQAAAAGAAAAAGGQQQEAQAQAAQAQRALAAAQAALAEMQAGVEPATPDQGEAASGQGGQGQGQGQQAPAQGGDQPPGTGMGGAGGHGASGGGSVQAALAKSRGASSFLGLPERDRAALEQSQAEKYPQEYGSMIEEYMRSVAGDAGGK